MLITEMENNFTNISKLKDKDDDEALPAFWGLKVSPEEPQIVSFSIGLKITQAILGDSCTDESDKKRSVLLCKIGDKPEVNLCSLRLNGREMCSLRLVFQGPGDIVFSVKGPREIHLNGYLYDDHVIPTQVLGEQGGNGADKDQPSCSSLGGVETSKNTTESVQKASKTSYKPVLNMNFHTLVNLPEADIENGLNKVIKDGSIDIMLQGVAQAQIKAFSKSLDDKLESEKSARRKLHYSLENEVRERVEQDASHRTTTQAIIPYEESNVDGNVVGRSTRHGSPEYHVLHSKKRKRLNKQKKHDEEDDDDHNRSEKHDTLQTPKTEFDEAEKLRKKSKKHKQVEADHNSDHVVDIGKAKKPKKNEVAQEEVRSQEAGHVHIVLALPCQGKH